jgi:hypothetical protein
MEGYSAGKLIYQTNVCWGKWELTCEYFPYILGLIYHALGIIVKEIERGKALSSQLTAVSHPA